MIQVDISNIWCALSLRDLLGVERDVFRAHMNVTEDCVPGRMTTSGQMDRILAAGERIREESEVLLIVGGGSGIRGVVEMIQGAHRNLGRGRGDPQIFFTGDNLSTRAWNALLRQIEGKDISLCVISQTGRNPERDIAFRNLKWLLERRYGTDEARQRIYAVTAEEIPLRAMAREAGWETFEIPANGQEGNEIFSAAGLLPMAAAGIDIRALRRGAEAAWEAFDLRSYENPVWLYAAARNLLGMKGKKLEVLRTPEPDFSCLGVWWQGLFQGIGNAVPICAGLTENLWLHPTQEHAQGIMETILRFDPPEQKTVICMDVKDLDGLNHLAGSTLDQVEETAFQSLTETHTDMGIPVITIDCGTPDAETLGQLLWFFLLSRAISLGLSGS